MPNEHTHEYTKALYDYAVNVSRGQDTVHAIGLLERLVEIGDPFYTPFALSLLAQNYKKLGRDDLEMQTRKRVTKLPKDQQLLLHPSWVAACYQKNGDLKAAGDILAQILKLTPHDPDIAAGVAEISLIEGNPDKALALTEALRQRAEPGYQILGRTIGAFAYALRGEYEQSARELSWIGQFLISSGSVPIGQWDYRDLKESLASKMGPNARAANLLLDALTGKKPLADFAPAWAELTPTLPSGSPDTTSGRFGSPPVTLGT
jgi:tetratricopeptide (TPR) repeat protein